MTRKERKGDSESSLLRWIEQWNMLRRCVVRLMTTLWPVSTEIYQRSISRRRIQEKRKKASEWSTCRLSYCKNTAMRATLGSVSSFSNLFQNKLIMLVIVNHCVCAVSPGTAFVGPSWRRWTSSTTTRANMRSSRRTLCLRSSRSWLGTHKSSRRRENRWAILSGRRSKQLLLSPVFFAALCLLVRCGPRIWALEKNDSFWQTKKMAVLCSPSLCMLFLRKWGHCRLNTDTPKD